MDKNAIKKYAVWARNELIARVTQKAEQYEITENKTTPKDAESINGHLLTDAEKNQRKALIEKIQADGFEQVMKEVAYTWFNRFTALRFMEVNNYLPSHTRVFTNEAGEFKPQILADAIQLDLEGLDMDKVFELKDANKTEELYKYLLITQCNALSAVLPRMFQKIEHYTELLLPDYLLREGSVIEQMIALIPEEDWTDQVQIIGWLYQYYNSEPKDAVFAALKKNVKISKENIPAATQLFTPDWIVRYMVENSLGRLWLEGHPNDNLKSEWRYYLDEAEQEVDVQRQLEAIRKEYADIKPEDIRCIDPCMGSGHILCYMFDVLVKIYEDYGYTSREAAENIVEKNLWGLDIDERATQLSYFAVMMKARQYDRRFLTRGIQPHVYAIEESNGITSAPMHDMGIELSQEEYGKAAKEAMRLVEEMHDAKEYGSIIHVTPCDWELLRRFAIPRGAYEGQMRMDIHGEIEASDRIQKLINIGEALSQKYHVVVTNPPYMSNNGMADILCEYVKDSYPDSKYDLFAVFMERCKEMLNKKGYRAMITQHSWMFLASFERLRNSELPFAFANFVHLGPHAFEEIGGEIVQTVAFVSSSIPETKYKTTYVRLCDIDDAILKEKAFLNKEHRYISTNENYSFIPTSPFSYWISDSFYNAFKTGKSIGTYGNTKKGVLTGNDKRFVRLWFEIDYSKMGRGIKDYDDMVKKNYKWIPATGGGTFRKWYGNFENVINMENDSYEIRYCNSNNFRLRESTYYFRECSTWSEVSGKGLSMRYVPNGILFGNSGPVCFWNDNIYYWMGLLNSKVASAFLSFLSPTLTFGPEQIKRVPAITGNIDEVTTLVRQCIDLSIEDWNAFETSWEFEEHPLIAMLKKNPQHKKVSECFNDWKEVCDKRFKIVKENEESLNRYFIDLYGLDKELSTEVDDKDITIRKADLQREIKGLLSYAVGCIFGRYSLDKPGLAYAGGVWNPSIYSAFQPDKDAIVPICDDEYFDDDIVSRIVQFIRVVFGDEYLEENLKFIADALGNKGTARDVLRNYFLNDFYTDHLKMYQKRPIYWMFDSGKKGGFKCLIYVHRYRPDTIARIRTDYVHEQQSRYRTAIADLEQRIASAGTADRVRLNRQLSTLQGQAEETRLYEEKVHHLADQMVTVELDDGVKNNYAIFKDVLAKI